MLRGGSFSGCQPGRRAQSPRGRNGGDGGEHQQASCGKSRDVPAHEEVVASGGGAGHFPEGCNPDGAADLAAAVAQFRGEPGACRAQGLPVVLISPGAGMTGTVLRGARLVLVPVTAEHVPELRRILATPEVRLRWRNEDASPGWPFDDPSTSRFTVLVVGTVRGMVQYGEQEEVDYRHASIDIFLDPAMHGRGIGRDAVATLARHLVHDRGHHRLVIDPAADNEPAIRCYAAVGFRPVGIMRRYERDAAGAGWHDGLLMDLLAEELDGTS